jgi:SPP1 family predicted phage head-tail adaptor
MRAGALRHQIAIYYPVEMQNEIGEPETTWQPLVAPWCEFREVTGRSQFGADQIQEPSIVVARTRWHENITPKMRVIAQDPERWYVIRSVSQVRGMRKEMDLELEQILDAV